MILQEILVLLLITGNLVIGSEKKFEGESLEVEESQEFYGKPKKSFENKKWSTKKNKDIDAEYPFDKDYIQWDEKKHLKHKDQVEKDLHLAKNEINEEDYIDRFNKYGHSVNLNRVHLGKGKTYYHDKRSSENEKNHEAHEKPQSLLHDTNVNYIDNNKKISGDSELITETNVNTFKSKENYEENFQNKNDMYMKRYKKDFYQNLKKIDLSTPPINDTVLMARYIVHTVDWAAVGTLSGRSPTKGAPFVCVKATSDGMVNASSGIPFFYMSPLDLCAQDLQKDNRVSVLVTLSETEYCKNKNLDPQDPRCAKLTLSGKIKKIKARSDEEKFVKNALFSRHPAMKTWPADHNWYFSKLKIGQIILLDQFGGATYIKVKDYLNGGIVAPQP